MLLGCSAVTNVAAPLFSPIGLPRQRRQGKTSVKRKGRELGGHPDKSLGALSCHEQRGVWCCSVSHSDGPF